MDISVAIPLAYQIATGNPYTGAPGDTNWLRMLNYFNLVQNVWANEPGGDWESLYSPGVEVGQITADQGFDLPTGILKPSNKAHDYVYITATDGNITKYKTVPGPQLKYYDQSQQVCAISGGQILFPRAWTATDPEYGGTLFVPAFLSISPFRTSPVAMRGALTVDDPNWVIYYAAQEWAQPDVTLVQNVPSLIAKATDSMTAMKLNNQRIKTVSQQTPLGGAGNGDTFGFNG